MTRITVEALSRALERGERILIIDARSPGVWVDERIPGAIHFGSESFHDAAKAHPRDALVVVYCSCPNDASAVVTARKLLASGFEVVRPLAGGIDAWRSAGGSLA
jgi:rhodanese-related sulfurtransferase